MINCKPLLNYLVILLLVYTSTGQAQTVTATSTDMHSETVSVTPSSTVVEIPFTVQTTESYIFRAIAPVNGVAMSVVSPSGTAFVPSSDSRIHFINSATLGDSTTPGGVFTTDEITPNTNGV